MKKFYLGLSILGLVAPYFFFWGFAVENGMNMPLFFSMAFANDAASSVTSDLLISSIVFWGFLLVKQKKEKGPKAWPFIVLTMFVGLSCALPAYLYVIERKSE